jgi:hypothetical protein
VGPVLVDVPRSIGHFGGVGAAVALGLVELKDEQRDAERARALAAQVRRGDAIDLPDHARR